MEQVNTTHVEGKKVVGEVWLVVRRDTDLDESRARADAADARLGDDGKYSPLSVDRLGYLRVALPGAGSKVSGAPSLEELLTETNSLLRRLALAAEIAHGTEIPDPV